MMPTSTTSTLTSLDDIRAAADRIRGVARRTPLVPAVTPQGPTLHLKCENMQPAGAFKIRGAYNMLSQLTDEERRHGVITYSSGNHGQAVAFSARLLGAPAVIVMPTTAPAIKVRGARDLGAEVIFEGTTSLQRRARAEAEAASRGLTMVPPFEHRWIIEGQGTAGLEILEQCPEVRLVLVQIGGGGLISGVAAALKQSDPSIRVVGVEPKGAPKMKASLEAGHPVTLERTSSIADGLIPVRPGDLTFAHARAFVDDVVLVEDNEIEDAIVWLLRVAKLVVEPSGAATVAAVLSGRVPVEKKGATVAMLSGGNIAPERLAACAARI